MKFSLSNINGAYVAVFARFSPVAGGDRFYVYAPRNGKDEGSHIPTHELTERHPELLFLNKFDYMMVDAPKDAGDMDDWDNYFIVCSADCAFPPMYIVNAQSESDAIDIFMDGTNITVIEPPDLADYDVSDPENEDFMEGLTYDSNGRPHDLSSIHVEPVRLVWVTCLTPSEIPSARSKA